MKLLFSIFLLILSWTTTKEASSRTDVVSSIINIDEYMLRTLSIAILYFCPPDILFPFRHLINLYPLNKSIYQSSVLIVLFKISTSLSFIEIFTINSFEFDKIAAWLISSTVAWWFPHQMFSWIVLSKI